MTEQHPPEQPVPEQSPGEQPSSAPGAQIEAAESANYRFLARKYRPAAFAGLIGQEAMVRTLTNAMGLGRLAHAFILTGVRGVGKTTTARIIARCLNCVGADGTGGITADPCGVCEHCRAIAEDRHMDVLEMDAASRTGVDDIRDLIDGVRYRPTSARYKVYIIDEVHMLSKNAFNALLKTLEEPPEHVKFIFATTDVRKVPVTVLSRCQRFDLRRIDAETLAAHFKRIVEKEGATVTDGALNMIVRAADGSVRDGLSLFDQAIAHSGGEVGEDQVRRMLGLADRAITFDLLDAVMKGDADKALRYLGEQYAAGADPAVVLEDMLELTHWLTRIKVVPGAADAFGVPELDRVRGRDMAGRLSMAALARRDMAGRLSMAALARAWQMLLKGLGEVRLAPRPEQAAEMILVRLAYAAQLPTPAEALKALAQDDGAAPAAPDETAPRAAAPKVAATGTPRTAAAGPGADDPAAGVPTDAGIPAGKKAEAAEHPLVKAVMETFPGATIEDVRTRGAPPAEEDG